MSHGDMTSCNIQDHLGDEERIEAWGAIAFGEIYHFFLECYQTADAAGKNNPYPVTVDFFFIKAGVDHRHITGDYGSLGKTVNFTGFFTVEKIQWVEIL